MKTEMWPAALLTRCATCGGKITPRRAPGGALASPPRDVPGQRARSVQYLDRE